MLGFRVALGAGRQKVLGVVLTMLLLGLIATWLPARLALAVDPIILLREQ